MLSMYYEFLDFIYSLYQIGFRQGDIQIVAINDPELIILAHLGKYDDENMKQIYSLLNGVLGRHMA